MLGDNLVATRTLVLTEFVLKNGYLNLEWNIDDGLRNVVVWIAEHVVTVETVALVNLDSFLWLWRWLSRPFMTFLTFGRRVAGRIVAS